jgi:hypothetical protein
MFGMQLKRIKRLLQLKKRKRIMRGIMQKQIRKRNLIRNRIHVQNNIYNNIYLIPTKKINLSKIIIKRINDENQLFYRSNACIIKHPYEIDNYIINIRWINYNLDNNSNVNLLYNNIISLNSYFILDKNFNKISEEYFLKNLEYYNNYQPFLGIEDTQIFTYSNKIYYIGAAWNKATNEIAVTSDEYHLKDNNNDFRMNTRIITPSFYKYVIKENNWSFVNYHNQKCFIYKWYPLTICVMDSYDRLNIIETKEIKSPFFKNVKGSTSGVLYNNEIWFILQLIDPYDKRNYLHMFAVFDMDMNLLRYTPQFKLNKTKIEYCIGLIIEEDRTILSFSSSDTKSFIATYNNDYIRSLNWINE